MERGSESKHLAPIAGTGTRIAYSWRCWLPRRRGTAQLHRMLWLQAMTSREFTDERGEVWHVWDVDPESLERRIAADPHLIPPTERRTRRESRVRVTNPVMANGWLTFECRTERRRLAPIPEGWPEMDEGALRVLLGRATPASGTQRLLR